MATRNPSSIKPPLTVVLGPSGSGNTQWCLDRYVEAAGSGGQALLLVPSDSHAKRLKSLLMSAGVEPPDGSIRTFVAAIRTFAGRDSMPDSAVMHRTCQRLTLASIVGDEIGTESFFGRVRGMAGFVDALGESLRELKLSGVSPELISAAAKHADAEIDDPAFGRKASEIAALYKSYQSFLAARELLDEEDLPAVAAERIAAGLDESTRWADVSAVLVDGFFRLSPTWRDVLAAIAARGVKVFVTLPWDESRPLLFATPGRTLRSLESAFSVTRVTLKHPEGASPSVLSHVEENLFRADVPQSGRIEEELDGPRIRIFDAPNPWSEAEMVVRAIHREHEQNGTPYGRCAIIARSSAEYSDLLRTVGGTYGIEISSGQGRTLAEHPIIKTFLTLCAIVLHNWRRDDVIGFLKSSYTPVDKIAADSLRLRARRKGLRQGREGWRLLAEDAARGGEPLAGILTALLDFDASLGERDLTAEDHAKALGAGLAALRLSQQAEEEAREAFGAWKQALSQVVAAARLRGRGPMPLADFHRDLLTALRSSAFSPPGTRDSVPLIEPYDAGQIDARFVAVMGLTERVFPRRVNEDPFFRDEEREALTAAGLDLERQADRADDERLLFYMAATAARERLVLSFPRSAEESDTLPSFYLDEVRGLFAHVPTEVRTLADVAPRPEECVSDRDHILAECARLEIDGGEPSANADHLLRSRDLPRLPALPVPLQQEHGTPRRYSITEIESYNRCPFQHLMRYGLELRVPGNGAGDADKGTVLHAVMRSAMRKRPEIPPEDASDPARLETVFNGELSACMLERAIDASACRKRMMERALKDTLREFARREVRYSALFGATPAWFEVAFGQEADAEPDDEEIADDERRDYDSASTSQPLAIPSGNGGPPIHLCGAIDRVDLIGDGRRAIVLDYKLGGSVDWDRIRQGKSLQMGLYMLAVEQLWGKTAAAGCYESPRDRGRRRFYRKSEVDVRAFQPIAGVEDGKMAKPLSGDDYAEAINAAQQAVRTAVEKLRIGHVMPTPGEHCRWCDYGDVCRMGRDGVHDGEAYQDDGPAGA